MDTTGRLTLDLLDLLKRGWASWRAGERVHRLLLLRRVTHVQPLHRKNHRSVRKSRSGPISRAQRQEALATRGVSGEPHTARNRSAGHQAGASPARAPEREADATVHRYCGPGFAATHLAIDPASKKTRGFAESLEGMSRLLEIKLRLGVEAQVEKVQPGPVITIRDPAGSASRSARFPTWQRSGALARGHQCACG